MHPLATRAVRLSSQSGAAAVSDTVQLNVETQPAVRVILKKSDGPATPVAACHDQLKNLVHASDASTAGLADQPNRVSRWRLIEIEVIAPHEWKPVTSTDGVVSWVAYLRPSPLVRSAQ